MTAQTIADLTDDELRRRIAEKLGYTNIHETMEWIEEVDMLATEITVWRGTPPSIIGSRDDYLIPDWPHDAGAALKLCADQMKRGLFLHIEPRAIPMDGFGASFSAPDLCVGTRSVMWMLSKEGADDPLADVLARLWLAYKEREGDHA